MKLFPFPFKSTEATITAAASWPWPSCATATPKTLSFRAGNIYNTIPLDTQPHEEQEEEEEEESQSLCPHHEIPNPESAVMSGLRSERLFFDPGATSSLLAEAKTHDGESESESVAMVVMDSRNPFLDFRVSMAEVVEACGCGARDWEFLEELLEWYLRVNDETNHGYVVGAFVDLIISAIDEESSSSSSSVSVSSSSAATKYSFISPLSFSSSSTSEKILLHKNA